MSKDNTITTLIKTGEQIFQSQPKCSLDLTVLTYGAYVSKLLREMNDNDAELVNEQLYSLGYNMGCRMIDEFYARQPTILPQCRDFKTTLEVISKQAFRMFLNITVELDRWDEVNKACYLVLKENPLAEFVILPTSCQNSLWYSNILCGMIKGALEMISIEVKAQFVKDTLRGDADTVIRVQLVKILKDQGASETD